MNGAHSTKAMVSETDIQEYSAVMNMPSWQSSDMRELLVESAMQQTQASLSNRLTRSVLLVYL